ncbi:MAG: hypothetical protein IJE84_04235, partial [Clostridia bacterium]|nr:hypothetical protein [Clostridia bacterium]
ADVVSIAKSGVIDNPTNPFTGNPITTDEKYAHDHYVIMSRYWSTDTNNGNTFLPSYWAKVSSDIWNPENWSFYKKDTVLKEHTFPIQ